MGKNMNFSRQPIFNQLLNFIDKNEIKQIAKKHEAERYVKKFTTYHSIREILGLLANAHKLSHLGISYLVRISTLFEANARRISRVFEDIYMSVYRKHANFLADSRLKDADMKRLYIMDSTTISLFKVSVYPKMRQVYTESQRRKFVEDYENSSLPVRDYCQSRNIST
jgi:hypothetical protein